MQGGKIPVDINVFIRYRPRQRINTLITKNKKTMPGKPVKAGAENGGKR
jgi:hypothetical protein